MPKSFYTVWISALMLTLLSGCEVTRAQYVRATLPFVAAPSPTVPGDTLKLQPNAIKPMFKEIMAIDLTAVAQVALEKNIDIQQARERVEANRGRVQSSVGAAFPTIAPGAFLESIDGASRAVGGNLITASFNTFQPTVFVQWVLNPGKIYHDILAAKKRMAASQYQEDSVRMESLRAAGVQYYELVLAQARVDNAYKTLAEFDEFVRITEARLRAGTGVQADSFRAKAELAIRRQELLLALKSFYDASVALSLTLDMDATVTLVPQADTLPPLELVRDSFEIDDLLALAVEYRPDLKGVHVLIDAARADKKSMLWGGLGPQFSVGQQESGYRGQADKIALNGVTKDREFSYIKQDRTVASAAWKFGLSTFGDVKTANATQRVAILEARKKLDSVRGEVVKALEDIKAQRQVLPLAQEQVTSAAEALRLSDIGLKNGAATTLDVLHAQGILTGGRLRYAEAVCRYNEAQINLLAAIGALGSETLFPPTAAATATVEAQPPAPNGK